MSIANRFSYDNNCKRGLYVKSVARCGKPDHEQILAQIKISMPSDDRRSFDNKDTPLQQNVCYFFKPILIIILSPLNNCFIQNHLRFTIQALMLTVAELELSILTRTKPRWTSIRLSNVS